MSKPPFDLSLYLVTDSGLLPPGRTLVSHVEEAIRGGVTIVQLREKTLATAKFIELGLELHKVTREYNVPLLINDRVDVALAVGCEGVHIGWNDCPYADARRMLGDDKIIGLSVSDPSQASKAAAAGCDYIGVGPVFATNTKLDHNPALGTHGLRDLMVYTSTLGDWGRNVPAVCIGGVNTTNVQRVLYQSWCPQKQVVGVAVVSAIIASKDPKGVCETFTALLRAPPQFVQEQNLESQLAQDAPDFGPEFKAIFEKLWSEKPMVHHITNNVVKNFSANITLAIGASPIMSEDLSELPELAAFNGALVLNMGTSGHGARPLLLEAVKQNNLRGNPIVFDPVGAGATTLRRETTRLIINTGYCDIIKGNEGEIRTAAGESVQMKGVDTGDIPDASDQLEKPRLVKTLAAWERNIVVMTGVVDYISDGVHTFAVHDGHPFQGIVTGTGCSLASVIAACVAVNRDRKLMAVLAAVCYYNYAARIAAELDVVEGPGSWQIKFLDVLFALRVKKGEAPDKDDRTVWQARIERVDV